MLQLLTINTATFYLHHQLSVAVAVMADGVSVKWPSPN